MRLKDKIAIITGSASGIGKGIAQRFAEEGAKVAIADIDFGAAEKTAEEIGGRAMAVAVDVAFQDQIDAAVAKVTEVHGGVDVLVNNAGIGVGSPSLMENTDRDWDANYAVNVKGTMAMSSPVIASMEASSFFISGGASEEVGSSRMRILAPR